MHHLILAQLVNSIRTAQQLLIRLCIIISS
jgi:hypothetical protein